MDEFLRDLKNKVNDEDLSFPKEGAWNRFSKFRTKKDSHQVSTSRPMGAFWAAAVGLLLLLGSNAFWYQKNIEIQETLAEIQRDTIYITQYIGTTSKTNISEQKAIKEVVDATSIVENTIETALVEESSSFTSSQGYLQRYNESQVIINKLQESILNLKKKSADLQKGRDEIAAEDSPILQPGITTNSSSTLLVEIETKDSRNLVSFSPLSNRELDFFQEGKTKFYFPPIVVPLDRKKKQTFKEFIIPKTLSLHGSLGFVGHLKDEFGFTNGAKLKLGVNSLLSHHWRLRASVAGNFSMAESHNISLFPITMDFTPPDGSTISEIRKNEWSLSFRGGIDYLLRARSFLRPYIGIGYERLMVLDKGFKFEIKGPNATYYIEPDHLRTLESTNYLYVSVGADFNLKSNIDAFISATYSQGINDINHYGIYVNPGVYYHF
jgi:hypothetical protein